MTFERKIVVSLGEIGALIFECIQCGARSTVELDDIGQPPNQCPKGHPWDWNIATNHREIAPPALSWLVSLKRLRDPGAQRFGFRILLQFEEPKES